MMIANRDLLCYEAYLLSLVTRDVTRLIVLIFAWLVRAHSIISC
jgi:hypothetical protein